MAPDQLAEEWWQSMTHRDFIFYISDKRIGAIRPDGTDECYPELSVPNQAYWQLGMVFKDGRRAVLCSQEPPRNPNAAFEDKDGLKYARTHLWLYDFAEGAICEIPVAAQCGVVGEMCGGKRVLVSGNIDDQTHLFACDLDGGNRDGIYTGPGFAYGTTLSTDGAKTAFHITGVPGRPGYEIYVIDLATRERVLIASDPEYINFAPVWSPDNRWLAYQRCAHLQDPAHERADITVSRADGSEHRHLTTVQQHWFSASYGPADNPGRGSNCATWSPDGKWITFTRCLPGARTAWVWNANRPDTDHFNRDYRPDLARGGTEICLIDPKTGRIVPITHDDPPMWSFRCAWSPDGSRLVFARADVGCAPGLWVMDVDGGNRRFLTNGINNRGADHCRWVGVNWQ